jgi:hypothetical protein
MNLTNHVEENPFFFRGVVIVTVLVQVLLFGLVTTILFYRGVLVVK